jgi:hypothetical protein
MVMRLLESLLQNCEQLLDLPCLGLSFIMPLLGSAFVARA